MYLNSARPARVYKEKGDESSPFCPDYTTRKETKIRPQIITHELIEEICNNIAGGHSYAKAAKLAGISESTFFRWRTMGQMEGAEPIYSLFFCEILEASDFSESEALQLVRSSAILERNWRAAAWFLERRFPDKYAKRVNHQSPDSQMNENAMPISE